MGGGPAGAKRHFLGVHDMTDLIGSWALLSATNYRDEDATPVYGDPPSGQIQYSADGRMSAFLMDPAWAARGQPAADGFTEFFAYAGTWERVENRVRHHVLFSSHPQRIGEVFERIVEVIDADRIELVTIPEVSKSGKTYVTRLMWQQIGGTKV